MNPPRKIGVKIILASFFILTVVVLARVNTSIKTGMFFHVEKKSNAPFSFELAGSELDVLSTLSSGKRDIMKFDVQVFLWGTMHGWSKAMHYGNVYAIFPFGPGRFNLKVGQQIIPFGMQAEYDFHGQIFQSAYALNLGDRIDVGLSVFGILGPFDYWYLISNGTDPHYVDRDDNKVQTLRLAVSNHIPFGDFRIGLSALRGILPHFTIDPFVMMTAVPDTFIMKTRAALDLDFQGPLMTLRGELSYGPNGTGDVFDDLPGQGILTAYVEARIPLTYSIELLGMYSLHRPAAGIDDTYEYGPGIGYTPHDNTAFSVQVAGVRRFYENATSDRLTMVLAVRL